MLKPKIEDVAKKLNVSSSYISAILKGKKSCNIDMANKLKRYYDLKFEVQTKVLKTYKVSDK